MKRFLGIVAIILSAPLFLFAQTSAVSGNTNTLAAAVPTDHVFIRFELLNIPSGVFPKVTGSGIAIQQFQDFPVTAGTFSGTIYRNDSIDPAGTFYRICVYVNNRRQGCRDYQITTATFVLEDATELVSIPTAALAGQVIFQNHTHIETPASNTWTIAHGFGTNSLGCWVYDGNLVEIQEDQFDLDNSDLNSSTITFVVAQAGRAVCQAAGTLSIGSTLVGVVLTTPVSSQTITGGQDLNLDGIFRPVDASDGLGTDALPWSNSFFTSPEFSTSMILEQTTGDYTVTWDNPAAPRALSIPDPGATAIFMLTEGAQTINGTNTFSAQIISSLATGTSPLSIASTTKVVNLNVELLDDKDWAVPAAIGSGTPAAGTFTTLTANTSLVAGIMNLPEGNTSNVPRWLHKRVDFSDMTAAATADTFTIFTLPAFTMIHDVVGRLLNPWSGGTISAAVCSIGTNAGADNDLALDDDMFAAAGVRYELHDATANGGKGTLLFDSTDKFAPTMFTAGGVIEIQCDLTGDDHANATAGLVRVYLLVSQPLANSATESN